MRTIDTRGKKCPIPIIETRKAIKEAGENESFAVLTDNVTSFNNITRFLTDNKIAFTSSENDGIWSFIVRGSSEKQLLTEAADYCEVQVQPSDGKYVVAITSENMGAGDDALGARLMHSFFVALSCLDNLPGSIVFYNSGVKLVSENSEVAGILKELELKGVKLMLCGTCVDHFGLNGKTIAGTIGDMYLILQIMADSGKVIRP